MHACFLRTRKRLLSLVFGGVASVAWADDPIVQQAYLKSSNSEAADWFGVSAALSGDTAVLGADGEDSAATGVNGSQTDNGAQLAGAAYVFVRNGTAWTQQAYLKASNTREFAHFGASVAVSANTLLIGAPYESSNATGVNGDQTNQGADYAGAAYVFTRSGDTWIQQAYLKASNAETEDLFGECVAIDGDTAVVGSRYESSNATGVGGNETNNGASDSGAVYVFVRNGATWTQQAYLKASNTDSGDRFGNSVAISGNTIIVGAFTEGGNATGVNGNQTNNDAGGSGAAYIFTRNGTVWSQQAYLKASNTDSDDLFGFDVAIHGETAVVGAVNERSAASGVDGDQADNSEFRAGAAYVFTRNGTVWTQQAYLKSANSQDEDMFGDAFGRSVGVSGNTAVVGAWREDSAATGIDGNPADNSATDAGAAYVFTRNGTVWTPAAYLKAGNANASDYFGYRLAICGRFALIGALFESSNATGVNGDPANNNAGASGAAYLFDLAPQPEIAVEQPVGTNLTSGANRSVGPGPVGFTVASAFRIRNTGTANLTGLGITTDGVHAPMFAITANASSPLPPGAGTDFTVLFNATSSGNKTASIHIASNDADENPFHLNLTGRGLSFSDDSDGDGLNDGSELQMADLGFDWEIAQPALVSTMVLNLNRAGYFSPSQVQALNVGTPLLVRDAATGNFTLTVALRKSADLVTFVPFAFVAPQMEVTGAGELEFEFPSPEGAGFFRVESR